ncbi:MAG: hypothetical protein IS860_06945 [Nitrosopumilus sp.]|nr:hypothetical protein [Nitrosopumilus sp.]
MPNSESGLEIAIRYTSGVYEFTVYDHYDGSFTVEEDMDSTWMNTYTNTISGNDFIYVEVLENQGAWIAKIYNYDTSSWETVDSQIFDGDREDGWSIWEEDKFSTGCPTVDPEVEGDKLDVRYNGNWVSATSTYSNTYDTGLPCSFSGTWDSNYDNWRVND